MEGYYDIETTNFLCVVTLDIEEPPSPFVIGFHDKGGARFYYEGSEFIETLYSNPKNQKLLNSSLWKLVNT